MHWEPDVGFDPGSPGSRPGPKAGAKPLRHPGIPPPFYLTVVSLFGKQFLNVWLKVVDILYLLVVFFLKYL